MPDENSVVAPPWLDEVIQIIQEELSKRGENEGEERPALECERDELKGRIDGWLETLGKSDLHPCLREDAERKAHAAYERIEEIGEVLKWLDAQNAASKTLVNPTDVLNRLQQLADILQKECPTMGNLYLSMHIDGIFCNASGQVVLRTCKIGSVAGALDCFDRVEELPFTEAQADRKLTKPRRRARVRLDSTAEGNLGLLETAELATDPHRFDGLPECCFWTDVFYVPEKTSWSRANSCRVLERFQEIEKESGKPPSLTTLAREFEKSRPTITRALEIARSSSGHTKANPDKPSQRVKGNSDLEEKIIERHSAGVETKLIAEEFGIHRSTVSRVLDRWYESQGQNRPDGRKSRLSGQA